MNRPACRGVTINGTTAVCDSFLILFILRRFRVRFATRRPVLPRPPVTSFAEGRYGFREIIVEEISEKCEVPWRIPNIRQKIAGIFTPKLVILEQYLCATNWLFLLFPFLWVGLHRNKKNYFMGCSTMNRIFWGTPGYTARCFRPAVFSYSLEEHLGQKLSLHTCSSFHILCSSSCCQHSFYSSTLYEYNLR